MFKRYKNYFYGSALANSNIRPTNAYGWGFKFKKKSLQSTLISYTGVFHIGARIRSRILSNVLNRKNYSKKELFDAGCGMGLSSIYFSNKFKSVTGVDLDPDKIKQAKILARDNHLTNINFKVGNLLKNKFTDKKFDVVICFEVIEHVQDPEQLLKSLSSILKKDGKIILSFPSKSFLSALAQKSLDHYSIGFSPVEIKKLSKGTKLVIKEKISFGNTYLAQFIVGVDFFIRKIFPILSALLFPFVYPFMVLDLNFPKMGVPRGYVLILEKS